MVKKEDLEIAIFSCDKNEELWPVFYHCLEKYWPNHPKAYLLTESIKFKDIETICYNYDLDNWTTRMAKSLSDLKSKYVLFICDDVFINYYVNEERIETCCKILERETNLACINLELSFEEVDEDTEYLGFKKKTLASPIALSFLCGIWDRKKLISLLSAKECDPWILENENNLSTYDFYQISDIKAISWFRDKPYMFAACYNGQWSREIIDFLKKEKITTDLDKKGFYD